MEISIRPMPESYRKISKKFRPGHPPVFTGAGEITPEDVELAIELFKLLDKESQDWYGGQTFIDAMKNKQTKGGNV